MKIGLYNLEPSIINTAMMQVSQYHKEQGDTVEQYSPLFHDTYDKVYAFSIFDFTPKHYIRKDMICGGTGFDITSRLSKEIESCNYDWSLYPNAEKSIIWFSRGCIRNCPFCIVRQKEGYIHPVEPKNLNPNGTRIQVQDNNVFANPKWREAVDQLLEWNQRVDLQGIDIRIFDDEQGVALQELKHWKNIKIAWDNPRQNLDKQIEHLLEYIKPSKLLCYVLIGYWSTKEQDMERINHLWQDYQIKPYVMLYNKFEEYQLHLAELCNNQIRYKSCAYEDYSREFKNEIKKKNMEKRKEKRIMENTKPLI